MENHLPCLFVLLDNERKGEFLKLCVVVSLVSRVVFLRFYSTDSRSIFAGLPDTFEVARYHSLHGIREHLPSCLEETATSEDGVVMGIQHTSLPMAAVQFHPESILTSPVHGLSILKNALRFLRYNDDEEEDSAGASGSEIVGKLEKQSLEDLKAKLESIGLVSLGSKSELVVRLALWTHKSREAKAGRLALNEMSEPELTELMHGLGLKGDATSKAELVESLERCLKTS